MTDPLEALLVQKEGAMDERQLRRLRNGLEETIDDFLDTEINRGGQFPYFGDDTTRLMADAAICVLEAVLEAQLVLVREGWLDGEAAGVT